MENNTLTAIKAWITAAVAMLTDWLVGSAAAGHRGEWGSGKVRGGGWHKGGMVVIVCIALVADWLIGMMLEHLPGVKLPFDYTTLLGPLVVVWYIVGELGSLVEHAVSMGAKRPVWLLKLLKAGKKAVDAAGDKLLGSDEEPPA